MTMKITGLLLAGTLTIGCLWGEQHGTPTEKPNPHGIRRGRVALHTWFTSAEFKDIAVTGADGKALWAGLPDPAACERDPGGNWTADGGVLRQANAKASDTALHFGDETWGDYTFRCKARKLGGREGFILHVRERGRGQAIWANLGGWGNRSHGIESRGDFDFRTPLKTNCAPFETGRWYDLEVTVAGDAVTVKVDGKAVFDRVAVPEIDPNAPTVIAVGCGQSAFPRVGRHVGHLLRGHFAVA